ncbi:MAG TPA: lamin tail domain-containing protein [Ohtaekwangia sp.]|nr:lamin tail domain-containing protein [Ohtaekwangia sp.]
MKLRSQIFSFPIQETFTVIVFITFHLFCNSLQVLGQFKDDFTDEDFTQNPAWTGNSADFIVSSGILRLNAPAVTASSALVTSGPGILNTSWEFTTHLEFNPSSSNYVRIYLASDGADLSGDLNGYFIMLGNTADEISLYRQTGTTRTKVIDGADGRLDLSSSTVRVKVTCDENGNWKLYADVSLTGTFQLEGEATDKTHTASSYFGIQCVYTSTRSNKFAFDDFVTTSVPVTDTTAPTVLSIEATSSSELTIGFSEPINTSTTINTSNYLVDHEIGTPESAILIEPQNVLLTFPTTFVNGLSYTISVSGVTDVTGNKMNDTSLVFLYFVPASAQLKDVIITEIFADPSPPQTLPEVEFVEIFNRSDQPLNLAQWKLADETSQAILPEEIILPHEYLLLTSTASVSDLQSYGKVIGVAGFPSLNNSDDVLMLIDDSGIIIDSLHYSSDWFKDSEKAQGGWTLELIDPASTCAEQENWVASQHESGGTPGKQNSVYAEKPDLTAPVMVQVFPVSPDSLHLHFNEKLDHTLPLPADFNLPGHAITNVILEKPALTNIVLTISPPLQQGVLYLLEINKLYDCAGNKIGTEGNKISFALPQKAEKNDVLINEILFNPTTTGVDFVELLNASQKYINLNALSIGRAEGDIIKDKISISAQYFLLAPGEYVALSSDPEIVKSEYIRSGDNFIKLDLPSFNDDHGNVTLSNEADEMLDSFTYDDGMHNIFVQDTEGVSLERISVTSPSQDVANWASAGAENGYATPGYRNSNSKERENLQRRITVDPESFVPMIGQPDFTQIHYRFDQSGLIANVKIFDAQGHLIKNLADNLLLGTTGFIRWDGDRDDGSKARIGSYMIWFEVFNSHGVVSTYRQRIAIAGRF